LSNRIDRTHIVGGLPGRILGDDTRSIVRNQNLDTFHGEGTGGHADMMQGSMAREIRLFDRNPGLVHEEANQAWTAVLAGHVNGVPSLGLIDHRVDRVDLGNASHGRVLFPALDTVGKATGSIGRRRGDRLRQFVKGFRGPIEHFRRLFLFCETTNGIK
jgi:hypothetical protein